MLVLKSQHSFRSTGPDRVATLKGYELPKIAKAKGWDFAILADERSMAAGLDYLSACKTENITGAVGIQLSNLEWPAGHLTLILLPFDQTGLHRLIKCSGNLVGQTKLNASLNTLRDSYKDEINIAAILIPNREFQQYSDNVAGLVKKSFLMAGTGPLAGLVEAGPDAEQIDHAPWSSAQNLTHNEKLPVIKIQTGYTEQNLSPVMHAGLVALAKNKAENSGEKTATAEPRMPLKTAIPENNRNATPDSFADTEQKLIGRFSKTTLDREPTLPKKLGLASESEAIDIIRKLASEGLEKRYRSNRLIDYNRSVTQLDYELDIIISMRFSNYFLIIREAVMFAKTNNIPVGPGRGSAAGSMLAYCLELTDLDPLRYGLIFERFINPERVSLPDIDTDFCEIRRNEVIAHMSEVYGRDHVAHISTYSTNKPRGAIRAAGRILNTQGHAAKLIHIVENKLGDTKDTKPAEIERRVLEILTEISTTDLEKDIRNLAELSTIFIGVAANQGIHAGGIVLSDLPISDTAPLNADQTEHGQNAIQYDMKATEACGLVKFDMLGLSTLTIIKNCLDQIAETGITIDIENIPLDEPAVFQMIRDGKTRTIFQLEGHGMTAAARQIAVDSFNDIISLVALYRPGPMANIKEYGLRKRNEVQFEDIHPVLTEILAETYGLIVYQEQIIKIACEYAGYSLGEADTLRKAVGKKDIKLLESQQKVFTERAEQNRRDPEVSTRIWNYFLPFARYGFNKSHAAAYALIAYRTAWLKLHHPEEWFAVNLTHRDDTEGRSRLIHEARKNGIEIRTPDINETEDHFIVRRTTHETYIQTPMTIIAKTTKESLRKLRDAVSKCGRVSSFTQLMKETDSSCDTTILSLISAGATDSLSEHPPTISRPFFRSLFDKQMERATKQKDTRQSTMLFGLDNDMTDPQPPLWPQNPTGLKPMTQEEILEDQQRVLPALVNNQNGQIRNIGWLREIEELPDLLTSERLATTHDITTVAILHSMGEREHISNQPRVITCTVEDETGRKQYELSQETIIPTTINNARGKAVKITLSPAPPHAFIVDKPVITGITICINPLNQEKPDYPLIHIDKEIDEELMIELNHAILSATRLSRKLKPPETGNDINATHALLVPPSRILKPIQITRAIQILGITETFKHTQHVIKDSHP